MQNSKLIQTIRSLGKVDLNRLKAFVESPYYNKHINVIELMQYIYNCYPGFDTGQLERKKVYKSLFPGQTYDYSKLSHLMNYLQELTEHFLAAEAFNTDTFLPHYLALLKIKNTGLNFLYEKKYACS
ncbi:MAG: hypothetical protein EA412_06575 [Chitinophagaceae bacterium]|nr:MAG: hypothetical protein EA412_06575 [Chitinophagaceae bacterium]